MDHQANTGQTILNNKKAVNKQFLLIRFFKEIIKNRAFYAMGFPGIFFIILFSYLPMFGILIAFKEYNPVKGIWGSKWNGFKNFEFFFKSNAALTVTFNTIFYNILIIVLVTVISLLFAILLNETGSRLLTSSYKTIMLMPYFLSWIVVEYILYSILSADRGLLNGLRNQLGLEAIEWYSEASYWRIILPLAYIWKQVGYTSVIYVAAITNISSEYYEAAEIDGANKVKQTIYITLPMLTPIIITLLLLWGGKIFNGGLGDWGAFYNLPRDSGILYPATDVIDTYVYRSLRTVNDLGMTSAIGFYQAIVGFILVSLSNYIIKRYNSESSIF